MTDIPKGAPGRIPGPLPLRKQQPVELKPGSVVFFQQCKKTAKPNSGGIGFKGHGFGIFLGIVPPGVAEPTRYMMDPLMAGIGWVSFETVKELLGEETLKKLTDAFTKKYDIEERPTEEIPNSVQLALPPEKTLVGLDGQPLELPDRNKNRFDQ